jgi:serine/threonine protein kinase
VLVIEKSLVGQVVEQRYRIEEAIGRGAMGAVFRARHVKLGREVAVKVLHDHLVRDAAMVARFEREAAIAARLHHKNLVGVIDVGETPSRQRMMVLELVRGESLASIVAEAPLAPARIASLVKQLLHGLEHAHAAGLVHRDLKPENVIVEVDGDGAEVPRIVDFGIAVLCEPGKCPVAGRRITEIGLVLGTPAYMAPEQARGEAPDPRTDLFALGVMTYEMLAGVPPFPGDGVEVITANLSKDPPPISRRAPGVAVDPLLEAFARRLMARDLCERFASARAALDVLALIERDREAAAVALGIVSALDLVDTAPVRVLSAMPSLPRPAWMPLRLPEPAPSVPALPAPPRQPPRASAPQVQPPALEILTQQATALLPVTPAPAPTTPAPVSATAGARVWLGYIAIVAAALLALAIGAG